MRAKITMPLCAYCKTVPVKTRRNAFCSNQCRANARIAERVELICPNCGDSFSVPPSHAERRQYCTRDCKEAVQIGENHPTWKGGRTIDAEGYVRLYRPDHPAAFGNGHVYEHVVVAMEKIGRALTADEVVHHINRDRTDNRPENVQVMTRSEHSLLHRRLERDLRNGTK